MSSRYIENEFGEQKTYTARLHPPQRVNCVLAEGSSDFQQFQDMAPAIARRVGLRTGFSSICKAYKEELLA